MAPSPLRELAKERRAEVEPRGCVDRWLWLTTSQTTLRVWRCHKVVGLRTCADGTGLLLHTTPYHSSASLDSKEVDLQQQGLSDG